MMTLRISGYQQAKELLDQMPNSMQKRMLLAALRRSAKTMLASARQKAPVRGGTLRKQLKIVRYRDKSAPKTEVAIAVKPVFDITRRKGAINQYYGLFVHEGTEDTRRSRHEGKVLVFKGRDGNAVYARSVKGLRPRPFLEEAYGEKVAEVETAFGDSLAAEVEKFVNRNFKPTEH